MSRADLSAELAALRDAFGEADSRTQLVASALACGDEGVIAAVLAQRKAAADGAKALAAVRARLIHDASAAPVRRYAVLDARPTDSASPVAIDRIGCSVRSAFSLEQVPYARLLVNVHAGHTGLLGPALSRMQQSIGEALSRFDEDGRADVLRATG